MRGRILLTAAAAFFTVGSGAVGAGWSHPVGFGRTGPDRFTLEPAPRASVALDGTSVAAWVVGRSVVAVTGDARGRFSRPRRLGRWSAVPPAVAAGPGGAALVAWEARDGIHV